LRFPRERRGGVRSRGRISAWSSIILLPLNPANPLPHLANGYSFVSFHVLFVSSLLKFVRSVRQRVTRP
jgi:hypothetical protein